MRDSADELEVEGQGDVGDLLQSFPAVIWARARDDLRLLLAVGDARRIFGYPGARLVGDASFWESVVHPDDRAPALAHLRDAGDGGEHVAFQYRVVRPDGDAVWLRETVAARSKDRTRLLGTTVLAEATGAGPAGDGAFRRIIEACPKAIAVHRDAELLFVNDAAARLVGVPEAQSLVGRSIRDFLVPPERDEILERTAQVQQGRREIHAWEEHFRREDGRIIDVEVSAVPYVFQGRPAVLTVFSDVTERKRGEEARELFAAAFRASRDPIILFRFADEVVVDVNAAWERATGVSRAEAVGRSERSLGIWVSTERRDEFVQHLAERGVVREFAVVFRRKGSEGVREAMISAERVELSGVAHVVVTGPDLTEQRRLEQQQREAQKLEGLGRIAGGIAHDFNNILTVIRSYTQLVESKLAAHDEMRSDVAEIAASAERGAALTRQLLLFSRRDPARRERLDLNEVVEDMRRMLARVLPGGVTIAFERSPTPEWIEADRSQLEQVIMNLAVNARDAMPEGGTLALATAHVEVTSAYARQHALSLPPGRFALLSVADTGTGMNAHVRAHLFEPFFTTKPKGQGTGLGLSTSYAIAQQHGGAMSVESEEGNGTTVSLFLPVRPD